MMASWSSQRTAAAGGILAMVLLAVGALLPGQPPKYGASADDVSAYLHDSHRTILVGLLLTGIAVPLYVWFIAHLAVSLRESGHASLGLAAAGGGLIVAAIASVGDALGAALAQSEKWGVSREVLRALYQADTFVYSRLFFAAVVVGVAAALAASRGALPAWLTWLAALQAVLVLLAGLSIKGGGFFSPTGGMVFIGFLAYLVGTALIAFGLWKSSASSTA